MSVVETAQDLVGKVDYVFGSNDIADGVGDCSSFTQYVFKQNGIDIGRTTEKQWTGIGTRIDGNNTTLQAGDLVFFKNTYRSGYTDGVSHVGIYIGNGQFIHNSSSKGTTVSNITSPYWQSHFLGAKRIDGASSGSEVANGSEVSEETKLKWFGDITKVLVMTLCCIGGTVMLGLSIKESIGI